MNLYDDHYMLRNFSKIQYDQSCYWILISAGEEFTARTWAGTLHWPQGKCHHHQHEHLDHHHHLDHHGYDQFHDCVFQHQYTNHDYIGDSCILQWHPGYRARGVFSKSDLISKQILYLCDIHSSEGQRLLFHWWE